VEHLTICDTREACRLSNAINTHAGHSGKRFAGGIKTAADENVKDG
jgi:hypothetical protein